MNKVFARQLRLVTLLTVGLCGHALAQTPDFSLPPLPPGMPTAGTASPIPDSGTLADPGEKQSKTANNVALANAPTPDAIPELAGLPTPAPDSVGENTPADAVTAEADSTPLTTPTATPAAPAAVDAANSIADPVTASATPPPSIAPGSIATNLAPPPTTLPGLNLPLPGSEDATNAAPTVAAAPAASVVNAAAMHSADNAPLPTPQLPPAGVTWKTTLAPSVVPPQTRFNYKRQILPDAVYKKEYDQENRHLPTAVTREDYTLQLFQRVAANDVDGTRALLNTGLSPRTIDGWGQSLLAVARRNGAQDTERLLLARGANG